MSTARVIACLVLLSQPAAAVDFLHTEHDLTPCVSCPACQLSQTASSVVATVVTAVSLPAVVGTVELVPLTPPTECVAAEPAARGPPST